MEKTIKIGVVGCGYWGPNLLRNFRSLPGCTVKMMCDLNEKRLGQMKSLYPEVEGVTNFDKIVRSDLDAVVIATSVSTHYKLARECLLAGKHTLIEKPMAASLEECEELVLLAKRKGLVLMIGHTFLYSPAVRKIKEIIDQGDIGTIRYISTRRLSLGLFQKDINVIWDLAPHDLSIILYILREKPISLNCRGTAHITPGVEDIATLWLNFSKERSAFIQSSWLDPRKIREMTIVGSKRMIVYDDIVQQEQIKIFDKSVEKPPHYNSFAEFLYSYHHGDIYIPHIKHDEPLRVECQHFLDCVREGSTPISCGSKGMDVVRILEASSESLRRDGAPIVLANYHHRPSTPVVLDESVLEVPVDLVPPEKRTREAFKAKRNNLNSKPNPDYVRV